MSAAAAWTVLLPLAGACAAVISPRRAGPPAGLVAGIATLGAAGLLVRDVWRYGAVRYTVGGWGAPLGIELRADGLGSAMVLTLAVAAIAILTYATAHLPTLSTHGPATGSERDHAAADGPAGAGRPETTGPPAAAWAPTAGFWPLSLLLWAALNLLFISADAFNLYVALELTTLAAVALMVIGGGSEALSAAMRYLIAAFFGSMAYLLGIGVLYAGFHALDLSLLADRVRPGWTAWSAMALMTTGLAVKTALFPLHFWLPRAHSSAPAPVSALLSALVVAGSYVLMLRLWFESFAAAITPAAAQLIGVMGGAAIVWGSIQAIRQQRLKLMIAYSTVSQIGYLFLVIPLATGVFAAQSGALEAWSGGVYHAVSHAFAKAAMFLAAGAISHSLGHDRIVGISGIANRLPISTYAFGIAGVTLIGLPPSGGFIAKWLLLTSAITGGQWWWAAVILAGGILTAGYVFLVLGQELSEASSDQRPEFAPVPRRMEYAAMALALTSMALGFRAVEPLRLIEIGNPITVLFGSP
jgi:multicomponent Na+:H+ antiporter subunit D